MEKWHITLKFRDFGTVHLFAFVPSRKALETAIDLYAQGKEYADDVLERVVSIRRAANLPIDRGYLIENGTLETLEERYIAEQEEDEWDYPNYSTTGEQEEE